MISIISQCLAFVFATITLAQFPPKPEGVTTKHLRHRPGVSISYKETFICEEQSRGWAGYVHMPASYIDEPYDVSMFFWYFEARSNPRNAPTTIYFAGGPGSSSEADAVSDGGPCYVSRDANSTTNNPWSLNNHANVLYIDQPVSTGYSYTKPINSTLDLLFLGQPLIETGITPFEAYGNHLPAQNSTFFYGTFSEQDPTKTANGTLSAAKTLWHFSQAWFESFPERNTEHSAISVFGNSYGGYYVTVFASYTLQQNEKITQGQLEGTVLQIKTVGWTNGCVDQLIQAEWYPEQAYNNTYGLQVIPKAVYEEEVHNFTKPDDCRDLIQQCRQLGDLYDLDFLNNNKTVNKVCVNALVYCDEYVIAGYNVLSNRSAFDMSHLIPDPYPPYYYDGYFNQQWVQKALGVPVNFSADSLLSGNVFLFTSGDPFRVPGLKSVEYILASGVQVAMIYGDRDYRCPWTGGEKLSLAAKWRDAAEFSAAGYEFVQVNSTYQGGMVRQYGNLSFVRVFEAGHAAAAFQPETISVLFDRSISHKDLATGKQSTCDSNYCTTGPSSSLGVIEKLPPPPPFNCNLYSVSSTCTTEQYEALVEGTADVVDFNIVKPAGGSPGGITL